jgi:hypothetical protein
MEPWPSGYGIQPNGKKKGLQPRKPGAAIFCQAFRAAIVF